MKSPRIMFFYAGFLLACGLYAYLSAPPDAKATTALIVPSVAAVLMIVCGVMANLLGRKRTVGMIGIHAGLVLPLLFTIAFGLRAYKTFDSGGDAKRYLAYILAAMTIGSITAFFAILATRAPKAQRIT